MGAPRVNRPKTMRGKRFLKEREPKIVENNKQTLFFKGSHTSGSVLAAYTELLMMKRPLSVQLQRHNLERPFEETNELCRLCEKFDTALFIRASHSKKRPNTLTLGRLFNYELLDMYEVEVSGFMSMNDFPGLKMQTGAKPIMMFHGPNFDGFGDLSHFKNFLVDFFHGPKATKVLANSLEHVLHFCEINDHSFEIRSYRNHMKLTSSGMKIEDLEEIGPRMTWSVRRCILPTKDKWKRATFIPAETVKAGKVAKNKQISMDEFGNKKARVYVPPQVLEKMPQKKMKALKLKRKLQSMQNEEDVDEDDPFA